MATKNIVPRATGEGSIGTSAKKWGDVYADDIAVTNGVTASTFTGDLTGDVTGDVTGNVTGDVTGNVTGNADSATNDANGNPIASTYLPLAGGTMTGDIEFYDDLYLGSPIELDSTEKTKFAGLYSNKNNPHKYSCITFINEQTDSDLPEVVIAAGDGTNRNHMTIYGTATGGISYNGSSLTDGTFIIARSVTTAANPSVGVSITAPTVSGYQFVCWISSASNNTIVPSYINPATSQTSNLWYTGSIGSNVTFTATALYVRKW